jgi:hypothetical protein
MRVGPYGGSGRWYGMTGDGAAAYIDADDIAAVASEVLTSPGHALPDWIADALVVLYQAVRAGHAATVTNAVPEVTGRSARSYRQFAEAQRDVFTGD